MSGDRIIKKNEANGFSNPKLEKVLEMKDIEEVYLIGVVTDICVKATALSARELGYKPKVVKEAVSGFNDKKKGIEELGDKGIEIIELKNLEEDFQE